MERIIQDILRKYSANPARSLMKKLTDIISKEGFKIHDRETTGGAIKTWMDSFSHEKGSLKKIFPIIKKNFNSVKMSNDNRDIFGDGFEINEQGYGNLFIAVYAGKSSEEYKMGLDV